MMTKAGWANAITHYDNPPWYHMLLKFSSKSDDWTKSHECEARSMVHIFFKILTLSVVFLVLEMCGCDFK